ncbi:ABC transporter substrate-binding protein [Nocardioides sp. AN3]
MKFSLRPARRRAVRGGIALLGAVALLAGCGGSGGGGASKQASDTLVVALPTFEVDSPFPWEYNALGRPPFAPTMETLTVADPTSGQIVPGLAEKWEQSADGKTWTFHLRHGVQFHEKWGEFTSADVLYTFNRGRDKDATGALAQSWATTIASVAAPDKYTFVLTTKAPDLSIPSLIGSYDEINSQKYIEKVGDEEARHHPIGTGPYEFVSGTPGQEYKYKAVADHYRKTAKFKNLVIKRIADPTTMAAALRTGEIDAAMVSGTSLDVLKGHVKFIEQKDGTPNWIVFPETEPKGTPQYRPDLPWNASDPSDPAAVERARKVREAMNVAFNKQAVIDTIWKGRATADAPFGWYVGPDAPAYSDSIAAVPGYDPEKAKQLLKEAGYEKGFTFPVAIDVGLQPDSAQILPAFAQDLAKVGIKVEVTNMEHATLVGHLRAKDLTDGFIYAAPGRADQSQMASVLGQNSPFRFLNTFPDMWDAAAKAHSGKQEQQNAFITSALQRVAAESATIPIGIQSIVVATSDKVGAWPLLGRTPFLFNFEYAEPAS